MDREDETVRRQLKALPQLLSEEEQNRWQRCRRAEDRERFLLGRGVLRIVLGAWLQRHPASLRFAAGPHGKPFLVEEPGGRLPPAPQFNVSHSGRFVLLGFHPDAAVGVDVERVRADLHWPPIARRCLSRQVQESITGLAAAEQPLAFHRHWCRLEAELKARGVGFSGAARSSDCVESRPDPGMVDLWDVALPSGYVGAVACLPPEDP